MAAVSAHQVLQEELCAAIEGDVVGVRGYTLRVECEEDVD